MCVSWQNKLSQKSSKKTSSCEMSAQLALSLFLLPSLPSKRINKSKSKQGKPEKIYRARRTQDTTQHEGLWFSHCTENEVKVFPPFSVFFFLRISTAVVSQVWLPLMSGGRGLFEDLSSMGSLLWVQLILLLLLLLLPLPLLLMMINAVAVAVADPRFVSLSQRSKQAGWDTRSLPLEIRSRTTSQQPIQDCSQVKQNEMKCEKRAAGSARVSLHILSLSGWKFLGERWANSSC